MLIKNLIEEGWLKTSEIIKAFEKIKRIDFLPEDIKQFAEKNSAFSIGYNQTISQPLTVAFMLELLKPKKGEKILDIGSGSGWTTALLSEIVGEKGKVIAIDVIPELIKFGKENVSKYNFIQKGIAKFLCVDGSKGYEKEAPYDKILVSASVENKIPNSWKNQLKIGGNIVAPINNSIWIFSKEDEGKFRKKEYPGFVFVPLVSN